MWGNSLCIIAIPISLSSCMFASNYPVDLWDDVSPEALYAGFAASVAHLNDDDKRKIYGGTAKRFYRID